jgi:hypothetical protein
MGNTAAYTFFVVFWPPKLRENEFLLFYATRLVATAALAN